MKVLSCISLLGLAWGEVITLARGTPTINEITLVKKDGQTTALTSCHFHGGDQFCVDGQGNEGSIVPPPTNTADAPTEYTGCHNHGEDVFCRYNGEEVEFQVKSETTDDAHDHDDHEEDEHDEHDDHDHETGTPTDVETSKVTGCHFHGDDFFCTDSQGKEGSIVPAPNKDNAPTEYSECHSHGSNMFCLHEGKEVQFITSEDSSHDHEAEETGKTGKNCHFHAGVEHCEDDHLKDVKCDRVDRDYNITLRIGLLFVILVTSGLGSFGPMCLKSLFNLDLEGITITVIKQFGTGIIISTAFVHLITHAQLLWSNPCLALRVKYEPTGSALTMAGIFVAFLIEFIAHRTLVSRTENYKTVDTEEATKDVSDQGSVGSPSLISLHGISSKDKISVFIMEAGIVFHSILIGITLVVASDAFFITLFIVIVFHQFFEGLALGSRIVGLKNTTLTTRLIMALIFALITPIGMAIGIGTLKKFNGNDPSTLIALATLNSFSAGVLLWTGLIEMWSQDWLHGYLSNASFIKTGRDHGLAVRLLNLEEVNPEIEFTSEVFNDNDYMPLSSAGKGVGDDLSPELKIALPSGEVNPATSEIASLVIVCQDVDVPIPNPITHLFAYDIPISKTSFKQGELNGTNTPEDFKFGKSSLGNVGYIGPRPIPGHGDHRYIFQVFAINEKATKEFRDSPTKPDLSRCIKRGVECTNNRIKKKTGPKGSRQKTNNFTIIGDGSHMQSIPMISSGSSSISPPQSQLLLQQSQSSSSSSTSPPQINQYTSPPHLGLYPGGEPFIFKYPLSTILKYLDIYQKMFYGIWPVLNTNNLIYQLVSINFHEGMTRESSIIYTQVLAICGAISMQVTFLTEKAKLIQGQGIDAESCIKECISIREKYNHKLDLNDNILTTSLFLYEYYINTSAGTKAAMLYLREAISMAQIMGLHDPATYNTKSTAEIHRLRKLYYMLMITERYMCIEDGLPVILEACVPFPTLEDEEYPDLLSGFAELLKLFSVPDKSFFDKMVQLKKSSSSMEFLANFFHETSTPPSERWLVDVDKRLDNIKVLNFISDIQKVNILLSKHWMKSLNWHIAYKNGLLNKDRDDDNSLSLAYPKTIAYEFLKSVTNLPIFAFESNGPGVVVKLLEIAHGLADSINDMAIVRENYNSIPIHDALHSIFTLIAKFKTEVTLPTELYRRIETMVNSYSVPRPIGYLEEISSESDQSEDQSYSRFKDTFDDDFITKLNDSVFNNPQEPFPFEEGELENTNDPKEIYNRITRRLTPQQMETFEYLLASTVSPRMTPSPIVQGFEHNAHFRT
ncbi:putative sucrose utilization protein SUC1 [Spathaspora sp. JA1]|nr:putative sucrose utilization protein SUC1 [Spathaspora sp. JA1]